MKTINSTTPIGEFGLATTVRGQLLYRDLQDRLMKMLVADDGIDESPAKMIWLAVGIGLAIAAGGVVLTKFDAAQSKIPDPVPPGK